MTGNLCFDTTGLLPSTLEDLAGAAVAGLWGSVDGGEILVGIVLMKHQRLTAFGPFWAVHLDL